MRTLWKVLTRRKVLTPDSTQETPLARVLNTFDLTALGVGSTLGVGVYVLAGQVAKNTAGPAVILSFLIAAIASVFAGLCYAEFGARAPRAGSAYIYSYLCVGEFIAFVIGWNLILEYIIGSASVAKGMSSYIDNLWNGTLSRTFIEIAPMNLPYLSSYFDFLAFVVPILLSIALAFGMKESSLVNNIFTTLNICVVLFVIIAGSLNAHLSNWFIDPKDVKNVTSDTDLGKGGFFPFGIDGVVKGAATCFYGFVGFDCIATTGEEVKNPKKAIPISIILSLTIIFLAYFGTSTVVTLMVPYYEQDPTAPIPFAFQSIHWYTAALIVSIGAIFGLYASLFGAMFPLPRILYAMASDGLIFRCMGKVNERFKTPIMGTLFAGLFTGLMAALFNLESLVNMMSIGTLLAYTIVAASVLLLRYSDSPANIETINDSDDTALTDEEVQMGVIGTIFNFGKCRVPNTKSELIVSIDICIYCILCFLLGLCALHLKKDIMNREILPLAAVSVILLLMALTMLSILTQPLSKQTLSFQVPWVPLIPAVSILCNIYLMIMLDIATWIRFAVWMILGILVFHFSRRNISKNHKTISTEFSQQDNTNQNFHEEGLSNNVRHSDSNDPFFEPITIDHSGKIIPVDLSDNNDDSITLTPTKVLEGLDLVLDSFITDSASPDVMSIENVNSVSNVAFVHINDPKNYDFRDTENTVLHAKLLQASNVEDQSETVPTNISDQDITENSSDLDQRYIELKTEVRIFDDNLDHYNSKTTDFEDSQFNEDSECFPRNEISENVILSESTEIEEISIIKNENDSVHIESGEKDVHQPNSCLGTLSNVGDKNENNLILPPPPFMTDFESFASQKENEIEIHSFNLQKDVSDTHENLLESKNDFPVIDKKSLAVGSNLADHLFDVKDDVIDDTIFTPPIPPSFSGFNNAFGAERKKSNSEKEIPVKPDKVRQEKENHINQFNANSLKLVKLRHVPRPSLEGAVINIEDKLEKSYSLPDPPIAGRHTRKIESSNTKNVSQNEIHMNEPPKMEISKDAINSIKLRPLVRRPSVMNKPEQDEKPDSVQFGSHEFEQFRSELNEKLKNSVDISRVPSFFDSKTSRKKKGPVVKNDDVIEDNIDMEKARTIMQIEIESKLNILSNSKGNYPLESNVDIEEHNQGNIQEVTAGDNERPSVEIKD